jgi:hypothetical protein
LTEQDETLERVIETLKQPVTIDAALDTRVMSAIEQLPPVTTAASQRLSLFARRWTIRVSPIGGIAAAAAIAAVVVSAALLTRRGEPAPVPAAAGNSASATQFVLVAPDAKSVALVGDFNDWSLSATRLVRQAGDGVWWVTMKLPPGRYRYAFVVDGKTWRGDPNSPAAADDFGRPNSVVTIGGA